MACAFCPEEARISLAYTPGALCGPHFVDFFERRVKRTIRNHRLIGRGELVAVGVSGGKDSLALLHILQKHLGRHARFHAILIDEGIPGYRDKALAKGIACCEAWGVPYTLVDQKKEIGYSTTEVVHKINAAPGLGTSCGFCGTFRRKLLNEVALRLGADKLATGHNLDDECQSILMNVFNNDLTKLSRLGPATAGDKEKGLVPRIKPLYECPEKEVIAYCGFAGIDNYSEECCPFSWMARRNVFREMLNNVETTLPDAKFSILKWFLQLRPVLAENAHRFNAAAEKCARCGAVCNGGLCGSCTLVKQLDAVAGKGGPAPEKRGKTCAETKGYA